MLALLARCGLYCGRVSHARLRRHCFHTHTRKLRLDEDVRLGKGSRGSLFVFARKSAAQAERDRARWKVGGFGVSVMLACTAALVFFAVRRFRAGGVTELAVATAAAVLASAAVALVMRQGGIVAEDADYEEKYQAQAERARERAARARNQEP